MVKAKLRRKSRGIVNLPVSYVRLGPLVVAKTRERGKVVYTGTMKFGKNVAVVPEREKKYKLEKVRYDARKRLLSFQLPEADADCEKYLDKEGTMINEGSRTWPLLKAERFSFVVRWDGKSAEYVFVRAVVPNRWLIRTNSEGGGQGENPVQNVIPPP